MPSTRRTCVHPMTPVLATRAGTSPEPTCTISTRRRKCWGRGSTPYITYSITKNLCAACGRRSKPAVSGTLWRRSDEDAALHARIIDYPAGTRGVQRVLPDLAIGGRMFLGNAY